LQGAFYDEYIRAFSKTKELAEKKDMAALEELSNKQVISPSIVSSNYKQEDYFL